MSPEHDEPTEDQEQELYEDVPPRSIFAATWFRVVLVVIVLGVIGAVAVPYVLDWMNPPPPPRTAATRPLGDAAPLTPSAFDKPMSAADKPVAEPRPDATLIPAPSTPMTPASPARPEAKTEKPAPAPAKPAPAPAKPAAETKSAARPAASRPAPSKAAPADSTTMTAAIPATSAKPPAAKSEAKPATATKPPAPGPAAAKASAPAATGPFWVQVGAFKDAETAKRLAGKLREANFQVEESVRSAGAAPAASSASRPAPTAPSPSDQYDVHVTGMSVEELNKRLSGRGLAAETAGNAVVVKPSLPLRDAVSLSKDLAVEGFKVQVRRAGGTLTASATPAAAAPAPVASAAGAPALHRVRVGAFSDRAAAQAAVRELQAKGYKPFIARGDQ